MQKNNFKFIFIYLTIIFLIALPSYSFDLTSGAFSLDAHKNSLSDLQDSNNIRTVFTDFENSWNKHDINKIEGFYASNFINGDGLSLEQILKLTEELWESYPDIKTLSKDRIIRVAGDYATVESTDIYQGVSKVERKDVGEKGTLKAVAIGKYFLERYGPTWKIVSDQTIFEKVSIGYGTGNELIDQNKIQLSAPEQVISGGDYTTTLKVSSNKIKAIASIGKEELTYPQKVNSEKYRLLDKDQLERMFKANKNNRNELISATVGITGGTLEPQLLGLVFLTRRVNITPKVLDSEEAYITNTAAKVSLKH